MIKSEALMRLEKVGIFYQERSGTSKGNWYNGLKEDVDLTPYLLEAGMFEH